MGDFSGWACNILDRPFLSAKSAVWVTIGAEKTGTEQNPVYGDYSDVYISTEVTDRNTSYYSSKDMEGATQIMDLNSQYGK